MHMALFIQLWLGLLAATQPAHIVTYEVRVRGEVEADVGTFRNHVRTTLRNPAGWSMSGDLPVTSSNR